LTLLWLTLADFGCFSAMQWRRPCQMNTAPSSITGPMTASADPKTLKANKFRMRET
jgi:hypothetical protein